MRCSRAPAPAGTLHTFFFDMAGPQMLLAGGQTFGAYKPGALDEKLAPYTSLPTPPGVVLAEYVWIGGKGDDLRSKTRTLHPLKPITDVADLPVWNYDGSSTGQVRGGGWPPCHLEFRGPRSALHSWNGL